MILNIFENLFYFSFVGHEKKILENFFFMIFSFIIILHIQALKFSSLNSFRSVNSDVFCSKALNAFWSENRPFLLQKPSKIIDFGPKLTCIALAFMGALCDEPQKHAFERRGPDTGPLVFISCQVAVLTSSTMPQKMNCLRILEPSHRSTEKSRAGAPTLASATPMCTES